MLAVILEILENEAFWWLVNLQILRNKSFWWPVNLEILKHDPFWWPGNLEILKNDSFWWPGSLEILENEPCTPLKAPFWLQWLGKNAFGEHVPGKMNMVMLEIRSKQTLFSKWLPRPNHYAHEICIEFLSRTPVSFLKYLSPRPQNHIKNSKYSFLARMSIWR